MILANTYPYTGNGLGGLPDAIEAVVSHEINGIYELMFRYPVTGLNFDDLANGNIVMAEPDNMTSAQPFRIYRITKPLNGVVSVYARHICYDMQGIICEPFTAADLTSAFLTIPTVLTPANSFNLQTTRTVATGISIDEPRPLWKLLGGQQGSLLDVYGGEWDFDGYDVKLVTTLGTDRGVSVRYGKNMTALEQDGTIESTYSGVYPYWYDEESGTLVTLTEKFVTVAGAEVSNRVMVLDCSDDFENQPSEQDLRDRANSYITANSVGNAKTSWKVSFVDDPTLMAEQVMLGDTLHIYYERLGVQATARAVKTEYDVLAEHYKAITIGKVKQNLAQIIVAQQEANETEFANIKSDLETAVDDATDFIRNGAGYMRFIYNASNELVEIVSLDDPDISQASSVWRWNNGGFGHSSTGYSGNYTTAITQNGAIVADFITAGTLNANVIRAGIIQDALGYNSWNLATGAFTITNGSINITTDSSTADKIKLSYFYNNITSVAALSPSSLQMKYVPQGQDEDSTENVTIVSGNSVAVGYCKWQMPGVDGWYGSPKTRVVSDGIIVRSFDTSTTPPTGHTDLQTVGSTIFLYNTAEKWQARLSGSMFPAVGGSLQLYDPNGVEMFRVTPAGLWFYDTDGDNRFEIDRSAEAVVRIKNGSGVTRMALANNNLLFTDGSSVERGKYAYNGITFSNSSGTKTATYPASSSFTAPTIYSSRIKSVSGGVCQIGSMVVVNMKFTGNYTATNSPLIGTFSLLPKYVSALSCIDITSGINNAISSSVPCGVNTDGSVYIKTMTSGNVYAMTGIYSL